MPRDKRLYMTFPNDFWMHPKVAPLPVAAKWTFVEMNGYSRMQDLDGRIPESMASRLWDADALTALIESHPERPLVVHDGDELVIRDYAEHQDTTEARAERKAVNTENGRRGGRPRKNPTETDSVLFENRNETEPKAETETETETETLTTPNGVVSPRKRAHSLPSDFAITESMRTWGAEHAPLVNLDTVLPEFIDYWQGTGKVMKDWTATWRNGMRKQQGFAERDQSRARPSKDQQAMDVLAMGARLQQQQMEIEQ